MKKKITKWGKVCMVFIYKTFSLLLLFYANSKVFIKECFYGLYFVLTCLEYKKFSFKNLTMYAYGYSINN